MGRWSIGGCGIGLGWCGFGASLHPFPSLRLGLLEVYAHRGLLADALARAVAQARRDAGGGQPRG